MEACGKWFISVLNRVVTQWLTKHTNQGEIAIQKVLKRAKSLGHKEKDNKVMVPQLI